MKMIGSSRRFTQVYSLAHGNPYNGVLSIVVLNVIDRVFDSIDHGNRHAKHLAREAAHAEVGSSLQLRFLPVTLRRQANQMRIARPRKVVILDNAVQVEHQSIDVLVHKGNGRGGWVHEQRLVGTVIRRFHGEHFGIRRIQGVENRLDLRTLSQPLRERLCSSIHDVLWMRMAKRT